WARSWHASRSMRSLSGGVVAERVELAQVIGQLRQELSTAMRDGERELPKRLKPRGIEYRGGVRWRTDS
ncbi:MAG: hypothetical protein LC799_18605, partial [Actinobacteria bacterium]|nr:hypothetical protein [Actinomycetota bacterium]